MENVFKDTQASLVSNHLGIYKNTVYEIITTYVDYLKKKLESGETIKFLNVCYLKVSNDEGRIHETLAYVSNEIADMVGQSQVLVYRVLTTWEDFIIKDLRRLNSCSVRGLIRIKMEKNYKGDFVVRTKKSTVYNNMDVYVTTLPSFKRRAEVIA